MKEPDNFTSIRAYARDVWSLSFVPSDTGSGQVVESASAPVLLCYDVVNLEWQAIVNLGHMTVLAATTGTLPDFIHNRLR